ncbi:MAG: acyl-CoA dehydrogenase family protein [Anaerolineales bacterium]|nr:acyl-CoA dehydrogenase family protein [Anaerolineales bacterium]MCB8990113.1 acyl-CoA dehydrogenase family protein [Ardenticatenaceae bacterium]
MDFSWSDEQLEYKRAVIDFAQNELRDGLMERDQKAEFPRENWKKCAQFGIQGLPFPESYGGAEADVLTTMLTMEGLGYGGGDNGLIFAINAQMWSVQMPIFKFGTEAQKQKYLPAMIRGDLIGAHGMSEPDSGSDAYSLRTRAEKVDGGYILNGAKTFVTNAPVADMAVVFATVDPKRGMWGVTGFVVDMGTKGFSVSRHIDKMGLRTSPMGELIFEDCFLPDENRLGPVGAGANIFKDSMEWERACILGSHIGAMEAQLEKSIAYAREREQFGQPIGKFQTVANRIVDMKVRLETARLLLYKVAWLKSQGKTAVMEAAMAKLYLGEAFVQSGLDAIRTYGGWGYMTEFEVERDLRDALGGVLYSGTSDIQRNIIARYLGL